MPEQAVIEKFPTLVEIRDRMKKRAEETKAQIKKIRKGGLEVFRKQVKEKGLISAIKARREERLAKMSKGQIKTYSPSPEIIPPVKTYSQEEVPPAVRIKTY
jgi:hypothetical protein